MSAQAKVVEWDEYFVRCRRWVRSGSGKKVWETVDLTAANEDQARYFYDDISSGNKGVLEDPQLFVRHITERLLDR